MKQTKQFLLARVVLAVFVLIVAGCTQEQKTVQPQEITGSTACVLDGMLLKDYPGPKAQIHYSGQKEPDFFCDTMEMFSIYLQPETQRRVVGIYTQDMGKTEWKSPSDNWIDARSAYYVHGSSQMGAMGPTLAAFSRKEDAEAFANKHGGKIVQFNEVTPQMVDLHGGAEQDTRM